MSTAIIQAKLRSFQCTTLLEQENALKEIAQDIALMALSRAGFFRIAAFQGGTCLRILYGLDRFSEDLDFVLEHPDKHFIWKDFINDLSQEFSAYGFQLEVKDKAKLENVVKIAFLKADSMGGILIINDSRSSKPQLRIKLEIDTNPPEGSTFEIKYLDFPLPYSIKVQDLPSLFAGKCHALLCRQYIKGRDWYDFIWYVARNTLINFTLLHNAIKQSGPWANQAIDVTKKWLVETLRERILQIDFDKAKQDVARFLKPHELKSLEIWSEAFFLSRVQKLGEYL